MSLLDGTAAITGASAVLATTDVDGDGAVDVLAEKSLFYGPLVGTRDASTADATLVSPDSLEEWGYGIAAGDVNGDEYWDLLIGARKDSGGGTDAGAVFIVFGGPR